MRASSLFPFNSSFMIPTTPVRTVSLPSRVDSAMLLKHRQGNEPIVVVKLIGVGTTANYDFRDKGTRSYVFRNEPQMEGHILRIPLSLWMAGEGRNKAKLAHEIMDQRRMMHSMVILFETPPAAISKQQEVERPAVEAAPANTSPEMVATDTPESTRNVVGPGVEATVATAEDIFTSQGESDSSDPYKVASAGSTPAPTSISETPDLPLHERALSLVTDNPKRLKALSALLGVSETDLRAAIEHSESKIELANAGWVRPKA